MLLARLGQWTLAQRAWSKRRISATQRVVFTRVDELFWPGPADTFAAAAEAIGSPRLAERARAVAARATH